MKNSILPIVGLAISLQACTITGYRLRNDNERTEFSVASSTTPCAFNYSIDVQYEPRLVHMDPWLVDDMPQQVVEKFIEATEEAFKEKACIFEQVQDGKQADFDIRILISPFLSALPQEWLTGLSLGLIPSWGTRRGEFVYAFENKISNRSIIRYIDRPAFNHLIVFPVFWVSLIGSDEIDLYKRALVAFIEPEKSPN